MNMNTPLTNVAGESGLGPNRVDSTVPLPSSLLDLADRDVIPFFDRLHAGASPVWDDKAKAWVVSSHAQCMAVFADHHRFSNIYASGDPTLVAVKGGVANITISQGELHTKLRRFHQKLFTPQAVLAYRTSHIRPVIDFVLSRVEGAGKAELCADVFQQFVPRVICSLLGMPWEDDSRIARILELNAQIADLIASNYKGDDKIERALAASEELNAMLRPYVQARREKPGDDMISRIWLQVAVEGESLSEDDVVAIGRELYFAGSDTTVHGSANAAYRLLADPLVQKEFARDSAAGVQMAIEEGLRLNSVVQFRHRRVVEDCVIGTQPIRAGETVILAIAAAGHDPKTYAHPHDVDPNWTHVAPHLSFGKGWRSCIGAQLARAEMQEILIAMLNRMPGLRLDPGAPPPRYLGNYMRSFSPLHVLWEVAA